MNLFLARHAMAQNASNSSNDFNRKLTLDGVKQAELLGDFLLGCEMNNADVYISSSYRTKETAIIAFPKLKITKSMYKTELYLTSYQDLLNFINRLNTTNDIFILGHNEGISTLASYLTDQYVALNTASCVLINFNCENSNEISGATGTITSFFNPDF